MKNKKLIILIGIIILCIIGFLLGDNFLSKDKATTKENKVQVATLKADSSSPKADMTTKVNTDNIKTNTEAKGNNDNIQSNDVVKVNSVAKTNEDNKVRESVSKNKAQTNENIEKNNKEQNAQIKISVINSAPAQGFSDNSVIITNNSRKEVSENILGDTMRQWILKWQYDYSGFADCKNTVWAKPWLDTVSNETLASTFVEANGQDSPYYNITAAEFNSATEQLTKNQLNKPWPLTYEQASDYIHNEFNQQFKNETITKIVQNSYGYDVYSNPYNEKNKYPIIVIEGATGYQSN